MKNNTFVKIVVSLLLALAILVIVPWSKIGISNSPFEKEYKLGLDLQGGVELDYKIDLEEAKSKKPDIKSQDAVEGIKSIIEKRVNSLGTAEPTIFESTYGNESHIVVQIPTSNFVGENLTKEQIRAKNEESIAKAKEVIGRVVRLEFKEKKETITDQDKAERRKVIDDLYTELKTGNVEFSVIANKYKDKYENISYISSSGSKEEMPKEFIFTGISNIKAPFLSNIIDSKKETYGFENNNIVSAQDDGFSIVKIKEIREVEKEITGTGKIGTGTVTEKKKERIYVFEGIFVSKKPSEWIAAKTELGGGKVLDERYLLKSNVNFSQSYTPQIELVFNDEGAKIFAELTKRLTGKQLAIFVGGQMLTAPTVQTTIPDGKAVITGNYSIEEAKKLSNDINTGIVPAPIYLTSERMIDAKAGNDSLGIIVKAGAIGFVFILAFLIAFYGIAGLLAMIALFIYTILVMAIVKSFGIVLTLASIAGIVLSIGMAIDANILIFERIKEELREGNSLMKSITVGFAHSWSAIWDSHITSFVSALILFIFGVSLIKGFGVMLGIGIIVSLFSAMYISRVLIIWTAPKFEKNLKLFVGFKKK
ncbi:MAG: protein translocase subunit SecD [Candidatus Gracilibacteria bacterium]|nr:protein translocase subunit SecD [Candidatus Gracilibacteria bacterium]